MRKPTIIICGDIMLDHNIYTTIEKLANEAPIPVFNRRHEEYLLGGAGNVLKNLHSIGCERIYMFSAIGEDSNGQRLTALIDSLGVENRTRVIPRYTTTTKQRFFCENKLMFRCDSENGPAEKQLLCAVSFADELEEVLSKIHVDCIVLSDYNKGILYKEQCQAIIALANRYGVMTCVDPKNDFTKYIGCTVIKPNRKEAYDIFAVDKSSSIDELHATIYAQIHCKYSVITLAEKGITLFDGTTYYKETPNVHSIIDVTGAGDIVCCILAYFLPLGKPIQQTLKFATDIATKSIEHPGTYTIRPEDIAEPIHKHISISQAGDLRRKYADKLIVFTNGCFDLLHSGHVQLFKFCKEKGDIVVVGLNSDESIRRLKGPTRPINAVTTRTDILEAIQYIDHVIVFDEDTPVALLQSLRPDYLVKGGDYTVESILGREFAKETIVCKFVDGHSSTRIIHKIQSISTDQPPQIMEPYENYPVGHMYPNITELIANNPTLKTADKCIIYLQNFPFGLGSLLTVFLQNSVYLKTINPNLIVLPCICRNTKQSKYHDTSLHNTFFKYFQYTKQISNMEEYTVYFSESTLLKRPFITVGFPPIDYSPNNTFIHDFRDNFTLRIGHDVRDKMQKIKLDTPNTCVIGIHIRSIAQKIEHHPEYIKVSMCDRLRILRDKIVSEYPSYTIYVATDVEPYIQYARDAFGDIMVLDDISRIHNEGDSIPQLNEDGFKLGSDILRECLALSLCDIIYVSASNIPFIINCLNPNIKMIEY